MYLGTSSGFRDIEGLVRRYRFLLLAGVPKSAKLSVPEPGKHSGKKEKQRIHYPKAPK